MLILGLSPPQTIFNYLGFNIKPESAADPKTISSEAAEKIFNVANKYFKYIVSN